MALHGDLFSYPLPELLQWVDTARKTGALTVTWEGGERKFFILSGQIVATATPGLWERLSRVLDLGHEAPGSRAMETLKTGQIIEPSLSMAIRQLAEEDIFGALVDLSQHRSGTFHWTEDPDRGDDEWVSVEIPLRHAVFESLRRFDEAEDVERSLPDDTLVVRSRQGPVPAHALHRIIVHLGASQDGLTLGRLWLQLGLPRAVVARAVFDLLRTQRVLVDGARLPEADPIADMLEKGAVLLRERQFDAAQLIFSALLQRDPADRRVREFARMVEREHTAAVYRELAPLTRFQVLQPDEIINGMRQEERQLVSFIKLGWDVSSLVLASGAREIDTLKSLQRFVRSGVIAIHSTV